MKRLALPIVAALGAAFAAVAPAGADDPMPEPCASVVAVDKTGDQVIGPVNGNFPLGGTAATTKGPDNLDIERVYFNTVDGVTTANIQVANLSKTVPAEFREGRFSYLVDFDNVGDAAFIRAEVSATGVTYHLVKAVPVGPAPATTNSGNEDLKGKFIEGPHGVVQIEMPPAIFKPGMTLSNVYGYVSQRTDDNRYTGYINDQAPDDGATSAKKHTITECPAPEPTATPTPEPEPTATPSGNPDPQGGPPQQTPSGTQPAQPNQGEGQPAQPAQPAKKPVKRKKPTCQRKAKKLKGKKRAAALKKCKKTKKRR